MQTGIVSIDLYIEYIEREREGCIRNRVSKIRDPCWKEGARNNDCRTWGSILMPPAVMQTTIWESATLLRLLPSAYLYFKVKGGLTWYSYPQKSYNL